MKQHPVDLLPDSIRQRLQAGARTGQTVGAFGSVIALLVLVITYGRFELERAERDVAMARDQANLVMAMDSRAGDLRESLRESKSYLEMYREVAPSLDVSAVMATIINELPESVALDRIDISVGARIPVRTARSRSRDDKQEPAPRNMICEIAGFAQSDEQVAQIVDRLSAQPPFERVSLDFSRTRLVREKSAREFRLSCRIDLEALYTVALRDAQTERSPSPVVAEVETD